MRQHRFDHACVREFLPVLLSEWRATGGFTADLFQCRLIRKGWAVGQSGCGGVFTQLPSIARLLEQIERLAPLLTQPAHYLGAWHDEQGNRWIVDVSIVVPSFEQAAKMGRAYQQRAITNLETLETTYLADFQGARVRAAFTSAA